MNYIYDFDVGSVFFFGLTIVFYLRQKRLRDVQDRLFTLMLFASMVAVIFDFCAGAMEYSAMAHPAWLLYAVNMLFIFGMQSCLPLFLLYCVASAGQLRRLTGWLRVLALLPYLCMLLLLITSPFISFGILRINAQHIYVRGPLNMLLYVNTVIYILASVAVLFRYGKSISRAKRDLILLFVVIIFAASVIQIFLPRYLITASATALAMTTVFFALQSPVDQVNPLTGAFSRTLLPALLQDYIDLGRPYSLILVSLHSFDGFVRLYGAAAGDQLLSEFSEKLMARRRNDLVVYMDSCEFVVVHSGLISEDEFEAIAASAPSYSRFVGLDLRLDISIGVIPYEAGACSMPDSSTADYIFRLMRQDPERKLIYADAAYRRSCDAAMGLEASLGELLAGGALTVELRPLLRFDGSEAATEATASLPELGGSISPRELLSAVNRSGRAWDYYEAVLKALSPEADSFSPSRRLCLPLLPSALTGDVQADGFCALLRKYGFEPRQLMLSLEEIELASALPELYENIRRLAEMGAAFMVDSFAEGFTDMSLLVSLPLSHARLHRSLLAPGEDAGRSADLLHGLLDILADLGICPLRP